MPVKRARLSKRVAKLVGAERVCRVATVGEAGTPHLVPVCHTLVGDRIYFGSGDDARKVLNLEKNERLAVTVDLYSEDWSQIKGVMVQGTAKLVRRGPAFTRARKHLYAKYPQYSREAALAVSDSVIVEVTPTHVFTGALDWPPRRARFPAGTLRPRRRFVRCLRACAGTSGPPCGGGGTHGFPSGSRSSSRRRPCCRCGSSTTRASP